MHLILIFLTLAAATISASAENDQLIGERLSSLVRDERDRQDCMWRETLTRPRPQNPEKLRQIAIDVAALCSQRIKRQVLQDFNRATDLPRREGAAFDEIGAQERALLIGQQIRELDRTSRTKAPD